MQDFEDYWKNKDKCIADISDALFRYSERFNSIDPRLMIYIEDALSNHASHANLYELLGIRKELRLMDSYDLDPERVKRPSHTTTRTTEPTKGSPLPWVR